MGSYTNGVYVPTIGETGWGEELNDFLTRSGEEYIDVKASPYGVVADGSTDDTAGWLAAIAVVRAAGGGTLVHPGGTSRVTAPLVIDSNGIRIVGMGRHRSVINQTAAGIDLFSIRGYYFGMEHIGLSCAATAGNIFTQTGVVALSHWTDVYMEQNNPAKRIYYDNNQSDFVDNLWQDFEMVVAGTPSVSPFYLYATAGVLNENMFQRGRVTNSKGTTPFFYVEDNTTAGNHYAYGNQFRHITGEVCDGGMIALRGSMGSVLDRISSWDTGTTTNDTIFIGTGTSGAVSYANTISNYGRQASTLGVGKYDIKLETNGAAGTVIINPLDATVNSLKIDGGANPGTFIGGYHPVTFDNAQYFNVQARYVSRSMYLPTGSRPAASGVPIGTMYYDTTLSKPAWSNGTNWKDAAGTNV